MACCSFVRVTYAVPLESCMMVIASTRIGMPWWWESDNEMGGRAVRRKGGRHGRVAIGGWREK